MISTELKEKVLKYLYEKYLEDSGLKRHDILNLIDRHNEQEKKVGLYLLNRGFVGNQQFSHKRNTTSILAILNKFNEIASEVPKDMLSALKEEILQNQTHSEGIFSCTISMLGIKEVAPEYIIKNTKTIISVLGRTAGQQNLNEILQLNQNEHRKVLDLAFYLQALGYIIVQNSGNSIYAELTFFGKSRYELKNNLR